MMFGQNITWIMLLEHITLSFLHITGKMNNKLITFLRGAEKLITNYLLIRLEILKLIAEILIIIRFPETVKVE